MPAVSLRFCLSVLTGWMSRLRRGSMRDDAEGSLREAADLSDLERGLRRLEAGRAERFGPLPRLP